MEPTWLVLVPFAIAIVGNLLHSYSWHLATRRQFHYDYENRVATWVDDSGVPQSYKYGGRATPLSKSPLNFLCSSVPLRFNRFGWQSKLIETQRKGGAEKQLVLPIIALGQ